MKKFFAALLCVVLLCLCACTPAEKQTGESTAVEDLFAQNYTVGFLSLSDTLFEAEMISADGTVFYRLYCEATDEVCEAYDAAVTSSEEYDKTQAALLTSLKGLQVQNVTAYIPTERMASLVGKTPEELAEEGYDLCGVNDNGDGTVFLDYSDWTYTFSVTLTGVHSIDDMEAEQLGTVQSVTFKGFESFSFLEDN